jgi:hypothetical protein
MGIKGCLWCQRAALEQRSCVGQLIGSIGHYLGCFSGIYADIANTEDSIVNTNAANGDVSRATGFTAAFGSNRAKSRTLKPDEKVYVTDVLVKRDAVELELLTVDVATLADGQGTRYRAELNVKLPGLDSMTADDVKKTIDTVAADPSTASTVESKTVKLGMSPDEVKKALGNPDKIVDLGSKQVYIYKDMKTPGGFWPNRSHAMLIDCCTQGIRICASQGGGSPLI